MTDQLRERFGVARIDPLVGHQVVEHWYDDRETAERVIAEQYHGQAVVITAGGILTSGPSGPVQGFR